MDIVCRIKQVHEKGMMFGAASDGFERILCSPEPERYCRPFRSGVGEGISGILGQAIQPQVVQRPKNALLSEDISCVIL